jgi:hypothetical protein
MMSKRQSTSETTRQPTVSYDDQWVTWADEASEIEWACVAFAGFGEAASRLRSDGAFTRAAGEPKAAR